MTPKGNHIGIILGVLVATAVSFIVASLILKTSKAAEEEDLTAAAEKMQQMKGKKSQAVSALTNAEEEQAEEQQINVENVSKVIFACDAGMGSSAMGASILRNKVKKPDWI